MTSLDPTLLAAFVEEARRYLPQILAGLREASRAPGPNSLEEPHRLVHTIKGASSMVGLGALSRVAHALETQLEAMLGAEAPRKDVIAAAERVVLAIDGYLEGLAAGTRNDGEFEAAALAPLRLLEGVAATPPVPAPVAPRYEAVDLGSELAETFRAEAQEGLEAIGESLARLSADGADREALQAVRRSFHTLKGAASMVGQKGMERLAHRTEDLLDRLYETNVAVSPSELQLFIEALEALAMLSETGADPDGLVESLSRRLAEAVGRGADPATASAAGATSSADPSAVPASAVWLNPSPQALTAEPPAPTRAPAPVPAAGANAERHQGPTVRIPAERLDELVRLLSDFVITRSVFEQQYLDLKRQMDEFGSTSGRLRRVATKLEGDYEAAALNGGARGAFANLPIAAGFDELEMDRYGEFHLLSRELAETAADVHAVRGGLRDTVGEVGGSLGRLEGLTHELQDRLLRLRMVPFSSLASRLQRSASSAARTLGKTIDFSVEGGDVPLDKAVLDRLSEPLLHLVRNAVAHGAESAEERRAMGKPAARAVRARAIHDGTSVRIEVEDDGAGISPDAIRARAVASGLVRADEAASLGDSALKDLLFRPGFSTAETVTEVSGRGVGLDVVKEAVRRDRGTVSVRSERGRGTVFTLRIPLSLAVLRGLIVRVAEEQLAIPLDAVETIVRVSRKDLNALGGDRLLEIAGEFLPVRHLGAALGLAEGETDSAQVPVVVLRVAGRRHAFAVDAVVKGRDVVVKTLGAPLRRVKGVLGATLLGDGKVVLILDPGGLLGEAAAARPARPARRSSAQRSVMIVDDSPSVRRVLASLTTKAGFTPLLARDGVEALELLRLADPAPGLVLTDIEMPRMDGFELTASLRRDTATRDLPIVILTSRSGEKHQKRAQEAGANAYLVKPFEEQQLLGLLDSLSPRPQQALSA